MTGRIPPRDSVMMVGQTIGSGETRFVITRELGSGAMGTVYRADFHNKGEIEDVAIKVIALGLLGNDSAMARFEREAAILKQLKHKHIVRLRATGTWRKTPFIAMEFVDGEALDRVLARRGKLGWEEVVTYAKQLCEALQYAHEKGIIHRDLKPSNLMLASDGTLKLTDFGIAKDTDVTALTGANSTIGTAAYMSPEQCKGDKNLSNKSDLYSLGVVLFELLTGRKPFTAETTVDMFLKHVNEPPPKLGRIVPDLPQKFESLVLQLLEKEKEHRPTDAAWVVRMLAEVEQDIFERKSAGLDAATSRKADRRKGDRDFSEEDRDAARALRGKKKKKKKGVSLPWHQKKWAKAAGLSGLLLLIVVGVVLAILPPSAEKLSAAIDRAESEATKLEAAEKYLQSYGEKPGEATDKAARVFREAKMRERERQLAKRFGNAKYRTEPEGEDPKAYELSMTAIQAEKDGRLGDAANFWGQVKGVFPDDAKLQYTFDEEKLKKARWGWIAEKRVREIDGARKKDTELDASIAADRNNEKAMPFDASNARSVAVRARRLEQFGDPEKAVRMWDTLLGLPDTDENGPWQLLAAEHRAKIKDVKTNAPEIRAKAKAAEATLAELQKKPDSTPIEWRLLRVDCRDITDLFEDESEQAWKDAVSRARKVLTEAEKKK